MNDNARPLIQLTDVTKVFLTDEVETHALGGVQLEVGEGEYVSISGPSGCGKSTLLSILGLLDTPTGGRYELTGTPVENLSAADRAHVRNKEIGFIFQAFNLIGDLNVFENVELPLTYRDGMSRSERKERSESRNPDQMARRMAYFSALQKRAAERGVQMPFGRGGRDGGPGRGGPRGGGPGPGRGR